MLSESDFANSYCAWTKEKGCHQSQDKADRIYHLASEGIPTLKADETTRMLVHEVVTVLRSVDKTLKTILTRMQETAGEVPKYSIARAACQICLPGKLKNV